MYPGPKCLRMVLVLVFVLGLRVWATEGCWEQEKLGLLQLKDFLNNLNQLDPFTPINVYDSWVDGSDCCQWERVECDATSGRVIGLSLGDTFISESTLFPDYPSYMQQWYLNTSLFLPFEELRNLSLSGNLIAGCLDNEGFEKLALKLKRLEVLDLEDNELDDNILVSLTELSSLKYLDLSYNHIKGSIHNSALKNLISLKELHLSGNEIKSLDSFHGLINLEVLALTFNILNNSMLSTFGPFSKCLRHLDIEDGTLEGSIYIKDVRDLKIQKGVAANSNVLLQQSLDLFPLLKTLHFVSDIVINKTMTTQGVLQLKNLESLKMDGIPLQNNFLENIGAMTSLKILSLRGCGLNGTLSTQDICQLVHLKELDISWNTLRGSLPDCFSNLTFLEHLDLSSNQFYGNLPISPLQSLTYVDLSNNQFRMPMSFRPFFNHSKLKHFYGDNNNIYAEIDPPLAPRFQLNVISLSCCGDVGPLPKFLHHQHELQSLSLSNINLTGEFPSWLLENNTKLERLFLINNSLSGHLRLPFHSPMKLSELDVSSNVFNGHIPIDIGVHLPRLIVLNISKNNLDGSIPTSIGDMKSLETLDLANNRLSGLVPENLATGCSSLKCLALSDNRLQGQLFSGKFNLTNLNQLFLAGNNFTGSIPISLSNCSFLYRIDIGYNHFSGRIPRWMGNLPLLEIIMPNNHFEGPIPKEFCYLDMGVLVLSTNNISGTLPSCFGPPLINHIHLSKNRIQGPIPNRICKSSRMVTLDLSDNQLTGNIPNCIGKLTNLSYLVLKHNNLEGKIPNQFCQLDKLSLIDLSHNNLFGRIPSCLNVTAHEKVSTESISYDFSAYGIFLGPSPTSLETSGSIELTTKNMSYLYKGRILRYLSGIDLSSNKLIGEIPHEMGNFHKIVMLNLSHNSLAGPIPPSLSNLTEIESLDLSYNNLSGSIPRQFVELFFLSYFNVSYNNLSGKPPPRIAQFASNVDENSYWGNPFLCGEPLPKNCSTTPNQLPAKVRDDGGLIDIEAFCVTFLASYIMVLMCIAAIMYINPHWRRAWFYFVERCTTSLFCGRQFSCTILLW